MEPLRRLGSGASLRSGGAGWFRQLIAIVSGMIVLVLGVMFSLVALAVLIGGGLLVWGYVWWRTREIRRQIRAGSRNGQPSSPRVIEGEVIRTTDADASSE